MVESSMGEAYDAPTGSRDRGVSCPTEKRERELGLSIDSIASKVTVVCGLAVSVAFFLYPNRRSPKANG